MGGINMGGDIAIAFILAFVVAFVATPYTMKIAKKDRCRRYTKR